MKEDADLSRLFISAPPRPSAKAADFCHVTLLFRRAISRFSRRVGEDDAFHLNKYAICYIYYRHACSFATTLYLFIRVLHEQINEPCSIIMREQMQKCSIYISSFDIFS